MDLIRQKKMHDEIIAKKCSSYPCVKKDSDGNAWCLIAPGIALYMTDIYGKGNEPTAKTFVKEHKELCDNAIKGKEWLEEQARIQKEKSNNKIKLSKERWGDDRKQQNN